MGSQRHRTGQPERNVLNSAALESQNQNMELEFDFVTNSWKQNKPEVKEEKQFVVKDTKLRQAFERSTVDMQSQFSEFDIKRHFQFTFDTNEYIELKIMKPFIQESCRELFIENVPSLNREIRQVPEEIRESVFQGLLKDVILQLSKDDLRQEKVINSGSQTFYD